MRAGSTGLPAERRFLCSRSLHHSNSCVHGSYLSRAEHCVHRVQPPTQKRMSQGPSLCGDRCVTRVPERTSDGGVVKGRSSIHVDFGSPPYAINTELDAKKLWHPARGWMKTDKHGRTEADRWHDGGTDVFRFPSSGNDTILILLRHGQPTIQTRR